MSYTVFTDTSANLPTRMVNELAVSIVPFSYYVDGEERSCLDTDAFNGDEYYAAIKKRRARDDLTGSAAALYRIL